MFRAERLDASEESREEMALVAGSIVRGSRVKVSSIFKKVVVMVGWRYVCDAMPSASGSGRINEFW